LNAGLDAIRKELEAIAEADASSGRRALAKVTALRTLERLEREHEGLSEAEKWLWDESRDPDAIVDAREWHPIPEHPEFAALDNEVQSVA
jgi:hypothetical protein